MLFGEGFTAVATISMARVSGGLSDEGEQYAVHRCRYGDGR
jgi:hypothetical protein